MRSTDDAKELAAKKSLDFIEDGMVVGLDDAKLATLAQKFGIDVKQVKALATQLSKSRTMRPAAIQFLFLLANAIARLCFQEYQLRQRINELTAVYNVAMMLADARDLPIVTDPRLGKDDDADLSDLKVSQGGWRR